MDSISTTPLTIDQHKDIENDLKVRKALLSALCNEKLMNVIELDTTNEIWTKFETLFEDDKEVNIIKIEGYLVRYENLKMKEDERISSFMDRVNEITMRIKCRVQTINEDEVVLKILRVLPMAYKMRAIAIEELQTISPTPITRETLLGKLNVFELSKLGD